MQAEAERLSSRGVLFNAMALVLVVMEQGGDDQGKLCTRALVCGMGPYDLDKQGLLTYNLPNPEHLPIFITFVNLARMQGGYHMEYLPLTLLLLGALLLTMAFAHLQHRYYLRVVNHLAAAHRGPGRVLVSGISRGRLRGAVAILVVRRGDDVIERALVMEGSSILARFREQAVLRDQPLAAIAEIPLSKPVRRAMDDAVRRYHQLQAAGTPSASVAEPPAFEAAPEGA